LAKASKEGNITGIIAGVIALNFANGNMASLLYNQRDYAILGELVCT
jgi:hypothetical protein